MSFPVILLLCIPGILILLVAASLIRTLLTPAKKAAYVPAPDPAREKAYAEKLARMIQAETVSVPGTDQREKVLA